MSRHALIATDGAVVLRSPDPADVASLIAGRDDEFHRFLGNGSETPEPTACIVVNDDVVGWVDYDNDREWLAGAEVNVGYNVFASHRGSGIATRAVQLLMHHLAVRTDVRTASLLIDPNNIRSLGVGARARFAPRGEIDGQRYLARDVPPLSYTDGVVTIRPLRVDDLDTDLTAKDDEHMRWLWLPGQPEAWNAMTEPQQRAHAAEGLQRRADEFTTGPKFAFAVDTADDDYVAYVDCDLANEHVPHGEANISYSTHPTHRRRGYATRAARLVTEFLADHTGARAAHVLVDPENVASLGVMRALGAGAPEQVNGRTMVRLVLAVAGPTRFNTERA